MLHTIKNVAYNKKCCIQKKIWIKMLYTIKKHRGTSSYWSCFSSSGHFVNFFLGCTSGLNLAAGLGPVLALFLSI